VPRQEPTGRIQPAPWKWSTEGRSARISLTITHVGRGRHPFWEQIGEGNPELRAHYLRYLDHILDAIGDKGNVIIDLCNELGDGGLDVRRSKLWIELTLDHIEAWRRGDVIRKATLPIPLGQLSLHIGRELWTMTVLFIRQER
jgi:hypothetical protein